MFLKKRKRKEIKFLLKELPKLNKKVRKFFNINSKKGEIENIESQVSFKNKKLLKMISKYLDYQISEKEQRKINKLTLLKRKHLKDSFYFSITGIGDSNKSFYKESNLKDWTEKNWLFQKEALVCSVSEKKKLEEKTELEKLREEAVKMFGEKYEELYLYGTWVRWIEDKRLVYGELASLESWVVDEVEESIRLFKKKNIPSTLVSPINELFTASEENDGYSVMNVEERAGGKEEELKKFEAVMRKEKEQIVKEIMNEFKLKFTGMSFRNIRDDQFTKPEDTMVSLYIPDLKTAETISTKNILRDLNKIEQPFQLVENEFERIEKKLDFVGLMKKHLNKIEEENEK